MTLKGKRQKWMSFKATRGLRVQISQQKKAFHILWKASELQIQGKSVILGGTY
jgi:hypothetical protein